MKEPKSYVCERSVEYALIPELVKLLKSKYKNVVAIFPWATREGSKTSLDVNGGLTFKVIGIYARRPKLHASSDKITVKLNESIIFAARKAADLGLPLIAGSILARSFFDLAATEKSVYFNLNTLPLDIDEIEAEFDCKGKVDADICPIIDHKEILKIIDTSAKQLDVQGFMNIVKEIKAASSGLDYYNPMVYMGGYKPVYVLFSEEI